jgi:hypothetical protein
VGVPSDILVERQEGDGDSRYSESSKLPVMGFRDTRLLSLLTLKIFLISYFFLISYPQGSLSSVFSTSD